MILACHLSELLRRSGDLDGSARYAEVVLKDAQVTGDRRARACWCNLVGLIHQERGELERSIEYFEEFLKLRARIEAGVASARGRPGQ